MRTSIVSLVSALFVMHQVVAGSAKAIDNNFEYEERIVGGKEVVARIPHQVAIQIQRSDNTPIKTPLCGGSLISEIYVLSAAQCLDRVSTEFAKYEVMVTAGGIFLNMNVTDGELQTDGQSVPAKRVIVHPQWNNRTLENDIAIVETFPFPVVPGKLEPIRLPSKKQTSWSFWMWSATTSGWGKLRTDSADTATVLHSVESRILKNAYCQFKYSSELVKNTNICTSGTNLRGLCTGDEGGPLFVKERDQKLTLLGISSFKGSGMECETSQPTVYTRVANEDYLQWINAVTNIPRRS